MPPQWHKDGKIDLYAMAGLVSFDSFNVQRRRTVVRSTNADGTIESSLPINRWSLAHYIDSGGKEGTHSCLRAVEARRG